MFTWPEIVLLLLRLANAIMGEVNDQRQFTAGADSEIAKMALKIAGKTAAGKAIMEKVDAMSDQEVDDALRDLEPGNAENLRR